MEEIKPVSYTHLDVYKRQPSGAGVRINGSFPGIKAGFYTVSVSHINIDYPPRGNVSFLNCTVGPVSYTHLDVYKRQAQYNKTISSFEHRFIPRAQKLKNLGVTSTKELPRACLLYTSRCV